MDEPTPAGGLGEPEDADGEDEAQEEGSGPVGFDRWRSESAVGGVVTGVARGLRDVFAPPPDPPAIVASVPGDPPDADQRVRVILDPDDPAKSVAIVPGEAPPEPPHPT